MDLNFLAQKLLVCTFVITEVTLHYCPRKIVAKIKMLKNKCHKALNSLLFVSSTDWSADNTVLLN